MAKFPEKKATVKAWCDASFNFGLTVGPVIGAFMYNYGGFCLPFAVTGAAIIASGVLVYYLTEVRIQLYSILHFLIFGSLVSYYEE